MNENDVITLLAEANPVRVDDLEPLDLPRLVHRRMPSRRLVLAIAVVGVAIAASLIGLFAFRGTSSRPTASSGDGRDAPFAITLAHPLAPEANEVSLRAATTTFGPALVLPDTSLVGPSDVGAVWMYANSAKSAVTVAVTFPKQRIFIQYIRPYGVARGFDARAHYAAIARESSYFHVLDLSGYPALAADQNSDQTGHNFGVVLVAVRGVEIRVFGHYDQATLKSIAQSIVDQAPAPDIPAGIDLFPVPQPWRRIPLRTASTTLGAPVVLPHRSLTGPSGEVQADGNCRPNCLIAIRFPTGRLSVLYERPAFISVRELAKKVDGAGRLVSLNGVAGLVVNVHGLTPSSSWIAFVLNGTRIVVSGHRSDASLKAVAESIVVRSRSQG